MFNLQKFQKKNADNKIGIGSFSFLAIKGSKNLIDRDARLPSSDFNFPLSLLFSF